MAISVAVPVDLEFFKSPEILPEQDLALAVLEQAIDDLRYTGAPRVKGAKGSKDHVHLITQQARSFLCSKDCAYWCNLAGVEVDYIVTLARKKYPQAFQF